MVDGGRQNEMEINFKILRPNGVPLTADFRKAENTHRSTVEEAGDYKICFDNSISTYSNKLVFFELIVESADDDAVEEIFAGTAPDDEEEHYDVKIQDIHEALRTIKDHITRSRGFQEKIRAHEFRDRSIAEHNFERVNFWSILQLAIMGVAGLAQVVLVRSLFDEKSVLHGLWKKQH